MKDLLDMTPEEIREWEAAQREKSRRQFEGQPMPEISRVKAADYPHLQRSGWGFALAAGAPVRIWRSSDATAEEGTVTGLRAVGDGGVLALTVRAGDGTSWALRRHDGRAEWADRVTTRWSDTDELVVPVTAWAVDDISAEELPAPSGTQAWRVQSAQLGSHG